MTKIYQVNLTDTEKHQLLSMINKGQAGARKIKRANLLLLADKGETDSTIAKTLHASPSTIERTRKRFVAEGLTAALNEKKRSGRPRLMDGKQTAFLVASACSNPPSGRDKWTMQLLADRLIQLGVVATISDETVRRTLKKTISNRGRISHGASPK